MNVTNLKSFKRLIQILRAAPFVELELLKPANFNKFGQQSKIQ